ncbi:MAG TPA: glycosyltransferase family 39 protein [Candidatus Binataceae bacterium]|nr:glycosyltransferase family 39 protein [Candidatus Binataceae bacterium]
MQVDRDRCVRGMCAIAGRFHDWMARPQALVAVVATVIGVSVISLGRYPAIGGDEIYLSAPALHLVTHGTLARTFQRGGFEIFDCFPPVLPLVLASFYKVFGFGVIQTKLPTLLFGLATAAILFELARQLGGLRAASLAVAVFVLDPITYRTWQSGRYDVVFVFFIAATLLISRWCATNGARGMSPVYWGIAGLVTGLAGATYYPFAAIGLAVCGIAMLSSLPIQAALRSKAISTLAFLAGFAIVAASLFWFLLPHLQLCRAEMAGISRDYLDPRIGWRNELYRIGSEWRRYEHYAVAQLGFPNLALGIVILCIIPKTSRGRWESVCLWLAPLLFMVFLTAYGTKTSPRYLATVVAFWCLGLAFVEGQIERQKLPVLGRLAIRPLASLAILAGLVRLLLIVFTLTYQWQGRDYPAFDREIRASIPPGAAVIGPQTVWYALATRTSRLWLYAQGYKTLNTAVGEDAMNDPGSLGDVQYVILTQWVGENLSGLKAYVHANFRLIRRIHPPFAPLPWAKGAPLSADIYQRLKPGPGSERWRRDGAGAQGCYPAIPGLTERSYYPIEAEIPDESEHRSMWSVPLSKLRALHRSGGPSQPLLLLAQSLDGCGDARNRARSGG